MNGAAILMYHRIGSPDCDPWGIAVTPERFAEQLQSLRSLGTPRPLRQVVARVKAGLPPIPGSICVTFDDGYADNLHIAAPLLSRNEFPATIFAISDAIGASAEFWWDELAQALLRPSRLPKDLSLDVSGREVRFSLDQACDYPIEARLNDRLWSVEKAGRPSPRLAFFRSVYGALSTADVEDRQYALRRLSEWSWTAAAVRTSHLPLSAEEAIALSRQESIDIGAHTVTHPKLPELDREAQRRELSESRSALEGLLGLSVRELSYPYGAFSATTVALAREVGFESACSNGTGMALAQSDLFALPRIKVCDWSGQSLVAKLRALAPGIF